MDKLVGVMQIAYYLTFVFVFALLILRLIITMKSATPLAKKILVTLDITSLSYYLLINNPKYQKLYNILLIVGFGLALIALSFTLHVYF